MNQPSSVDLSLSAGGLVAAMVHVCHELSRWLALVPWNQVGVGGSAFRTVLPADLRDRARARQIMAWLRSDLSALREERPTSTIFWQPTQTPLSSAARLAAGKLVRVASAVVPEGRATLFEDFSVADADLALMLMRLVANHDEVPGPLRKYAEAVWQRPSVEAFVHRERPPRSE